MGGPAQHRDVLAQHPRLRSFPADHGIDVGYRPTGYLLLVPEAAWQAQLAAVGLQREHGVPVDVLDVAAAARITPLAPDGLAGATWGPADGVVDPHLATARLPGPGPRSGRSGHGPADPGHRDRARRQTGRAGR